MSTLYPPSFQAIPAWARAAGLPLTEGRVRFAQYGVLRAIAATPALREALVFKGGNALDFVWQPNRSTKDLDFSVDMATLDAAWRPEGVADFLQQGLTRGLALAGRELGLVLAVQRLRQQPPGAGRTFITYQVTVAYALPDQARLMQLIRRGAVVAQTVQLDISLNEVICAATLVDLGGTAPVRVSTLDDIVAEKLRAFLQQPIRRRTRPQDVLDLAVILRAHPELDPERVAAFLQEKSAGRDLTLTLAAFHDPAVAALAQVDYAALAQTTRTTFVPFPEALAAILAFVDRLPLAPGDTAPTQEP